MKSVNINRRIIMNWSGPCNLHYRRLRVDWNDKMENKTATESWTIFKRKLDSVID